MIEIYWNRTNQLIWDPPLSWLLVASVYWEGGGTPKIWNAIKHIQNPQHVIHVKWWISSNHPRMLGSRRLRQHKPWLFCKADHRGFPWLREWKWGALKWVSNQVVSIEHLRFGGFLIWWHSDEHIWFTFHQLLQHIASPLAQVIPCTYTDNDGLEKR